MSASQKYKPFPDDFRAIMGIPCVTGMQLDFVPYKHSVVKPCSQCGTQCFVGPVSLGVHQSSGMPIVCADCLLRDYGPEAVTKLMQPLTNKGPGE